MIIPFHWTALLGAAWRCLAQLSVFSRFSTQILFRPTLIRRRCVDRTGRFRVVALPTHVVALPAHGEGFAERWPSLGRITNFENFPPFGELKVGTSAGIFRFAQTREILEIQCGREARVAEAESFRCPQAERLRVAEAERPAPERRTSTASPSTVNT
jgi:hypothetical protein